jgi:hypothetical protein
MKKLFFTVIVFLSLSNLIAGDIKQQKNLAVKYVTKDFRNCFTLSLPPDWVIKEKYPYKGLSWEVWGDDIILIIDLDTSKIPQMPPSNKLLYWVNRSILNGHEAKFWKPRPNKGGTITGVEVDNVCEGRILWIFSWNLTPELQEKVMNIIKTIKFK